ncbi:MAG: DUF4838 domain-containing protein [Opitutales bacterium]
MSAEGLPRGGQTAFSGRGASAFQLQRAVIVLPKVASDLEQLAAEELALHLALLFEREFQIVKEDGPVAGPGIFLGKTRAAAQAMPVDPSLDRDGYRIHAEKAQLFIRGGTDQGTLFGAYGLLQDFLGIYWLEPGAQGTSLPAKVPALPCRLDVRVEPSYLSRQIAGLRTPEERVWGRRNRLKSRYVYNHGLFRIFTPEVAAEHPEFFPIIDGERRLPARFSGGSAQPNIALPEVVAFTAEAAERHFRENPQALSFSIAQNDSTAWDEGPETAAVVEPFRYFRKEADYSALMFGFANEVAERLETAFPDKKLGVLAYQQTQNVPPFPVHRNVLPYLATDRFNWLVPEFREEDKALIRAWGESGVETFGLFDYPYGRGYLFPRYAPHWVEAIQYAHAYGATGYIADAGPIWGWDAPKLWTLAQVLWDVGQSQVALLDTYAARAYGEIATPTLNALLGSPHFDDAVYGEARWLKGFFNLSQFEVLQGWPPVRTSLGSGTPLPEALPPEVSQRVSRLRDLLDQVRPLERFYRQWQSVSAAPPTDAQLVDFEQNRQAMEAAFLNERAQGLTSLAFTGLFRQIFQTSPVYRWALVNDWPEFFEGLKAEGLARLKAQPPVNANSGFERTLFFERRPLDYATLREYRRVGGWQLSFSNSEGLAVAQTEGAAFAGQRGLSLENAGTFTLSCGGAVEPGDAVLAQLQTRGQVGPGTRHTLILGWKDAEGRLLQPVPEDRLPPSHTFEEWLPLVVYGQAPEGAAFWFAAWVVQYQESGDWAQADAFEVRVLPRAERTQAPAKDDDGEGK